MSQAREDSTLTEIDSTFGGKRVIPVSPWENGISRPRPLQGGCSDGMGALRSCCFDGPLEGLAGGPPSCAARARTGAADSGLGRAAGRRLRRELPVLRKAIPAGRRFEAGPRARGCWCAPAPASVQRVRVPGREAGPRLRLPQRVVVRLLCVTGKSLCLVRPRLALVDAHAVGEGVFGGLVALRQSRPVHTDVLGELHHAASPAFGPGQRSGRRSDLLTSPPEASEIAFACSAGARPFLCSQYQTVAWLTPRRRANLDWPPARAIARSSASFMHSYLSEIRCSSNRKNDRANQTNIR